MDPLITAEDVLTRYPGTLSTEQTAQLPALLTDASVTIRTYTRQTFTHETTTELIRPMGDRVRMRKCPVLAVTGVALVDTLQTGGLITLPMGAWMWDGGQEVWIGAIQTVINLPDEVTYLLQYQTPLMQVIYDHGYDIVPDIVITVGCSMVCRALDLPGPTSVATSAVGGVSYRLTGPAQDGVLGLTASEMRMLDTFRRVATTVELR